MKSVKICLYCVASIVGIAATATASRQTEDIKKQTTTAKAIAFLEDWKIGRIDDWKKQGRLFFSLKTRFLASLEMTEKKDDDNFFNIFIMPPKKENRLAITTMQAGLIFYIFYLILLLLYLLYELPI